MKTGLKILCGIMLPLYMPVCSCESYDFVNEGVVSSEMKFVLEDTGGFTKSSLTTDERALRSLKLMAFSQGELYAEAYFTTFSDMTLELDGDRVYDFYALANMGDVPAPVQEDEMAGLAYSITGLGDLTESFPMCWSSKGVDGSSSSVKMYLERLVAKVCLDVDSGATGLEVVSVSLLQTPLTVRPFAEGGNCSRNGETAAGDCASSADLSLLASGGTVSFYMFENMQGTLLGDNTDPMNKVPARISDAASLCTYLEVKCRFADGADREGDAVYRMFLGKDAVTNFDVERNHILSVSLRLTEDGVDIRDSWKVVSDYVQHATTVRISRTSLGMWIGEESVLTAEVLPEDAVDKDVIWVSDNPGIASVDVSGRVVAISEGRCVVKAVSADRSDVYAECAVTVSEPVVEEIRFTEPVVTAILPIDGGSRESAFDVTATYSDGTSSVVTALCSYESDSSGAYVSSPGTVVHVSEGKAFVTAELDGKTAVLEVRTEACELVGLELNVGSLVLASGETFTMKFRALFNDSTATPWVSYGGFSSYGLSAGGWQSENHSVADIGMSGLLRAGQVGNTAVSITVVSNRGKSVTASVSVTVTAAYVTDIYVEMSPMFYNGSSGPVLMGVFKDGSVSALKADKWTTSNPYVSYSENDGLVISDESRLSEGVTLCNFTATYNGISASAVSKYGKWVREAALEKTWVDGSTYMLRMYVVFDDFTRKYVKFNYMCGDRNGMWDIMRTAPESGALIDRSWVSVKAESVSYHYNHMGELKLWSAELR